jgi:signal transduction histidine kinase
VLLSNALHHGAGRVAFHIRPEPAGGVMQVSDEGDGIAPATTPRLFERSNRRSDHGIGLPLARQLAQADLGSLDLVTPKPPVFRLRLPPPGEIPDEP